jgi:hypothetical protein
MSDVHQREVLYARLQEVLGDTPAGILMTYLPPTTELATSDDIRWLGSHLDDRMDRFEERMDRFEERMDRFEERMDRFEERMDRFEETMIRFDDRMHGFNAALRDQTRNILLFTLGTMFSMVAGAIALASIL